MLPTLWILSFLNPPLQWLCYLLCLRCQSQQIPPSLANFMINIFQTQPASPSNTLHPIHLPTALECLVFFFIKLGDLNTYILLFF